MPKWIAVAPQLDNIKTTLEQKGFKTVGIDETDHAIHAMVYSTSISQQNLPHTGELAVSGTNKFVIMINADEVTTDEIIDMIN